MIYFVGGASASGKTAVTPLLKTILGENDEIHDSLGCS